MNLKELTGKEFANFVNMFPLKSIYQTSEYTFAMSNQGYSGLFLGLFNDNKIVAATSLMIKLENGFKYAYAPRGFLINYEDTNLLTTFTNEIKNYLNNKGVIAIKINPLIVKSICNFKTQDLIPNPNYDKTFEELTKLGFSHLGYNNFFEALKPRFEAIVDLKKPADELFKDIKKEFRTKIRSAINNGIEIYKGKRNEIEFLYNQTKGKYPRKLSYFQDCFEYFSKSNMIDYYYTKLNTATYLKWVGNRLAEYEEKSTALNREILARTQENPERLINKRITVDKSLELYKERLVEATSLLKNYPEGIVTSTILTIKNGSEITVLIDGFDSKYSRFNSKHLLIWSLIEMYAKAGFSKFNLGGLSNAVIDTKTFTGLNEFKLGFGSVVYEYIGDLELVTNKMNYNLYRSYVPLKKFVKSKLTKT